MANRFAVANGNFNDTATWSTTATGSSGASVPSAGDNAIANNRTVTITADATCDNVTNGSAYGGTNGGGFIINDGVTLNANVIGGGASASKCVTYTGTTSAALNGNVTGGTGSFANPNQTVGVYHNGTGTLTVTGSSYAGGTGQYAAAFLTNSTGILTISGNIDPPSSAANGRTIMHGNGTINISGNVAGHSSGISSVTISGASAIAFTATLNVTGNIDAGTGRDAVVVGAGTLTVVGTCTATNSYAAIESSSISAIIKASGSFISAPDGTLPIYARKLILNSSPSVAKTRYALDGTGTYVDMFTADNSLGQAAPADVRSGTVYADGNLTGTCAVPAAGSVALGVPVDATTGTAVLTPAAVWEYATREITGGTVDTLTNEPTVPSATAIADEVRVELATELARIDAPISGAGNAPSASTVATAVRTELATELARIDAPISGAGNAPSASTVATAVRTELATELARVDAAISTRLADADYVAPANSDVAAVKAVTDALVVERLANVATTAIVGNLIAQANS